MAAMDLATVAFMIGNLIGIALLAITWLYIDKLEKIGCRCSQDRLRSFIKTYSMLAIAYLVITLFLPPTVVVGALGQVGGMAYTAVNILFSLATLAFFVAVIIYVQKLMKEKCLCSEDVRREVIYFWSIIEIVILIAMLLLTLFIPIIVNSIGLLTKTAKELSDVSGDIKGAVVNPVYAASKVPKNLGKIVKAVSRK